jgi:signal transduction histidine kinase
MALRTTFLSPVRGTLYRRGAHLLLGGVILLPYVWLGFAFAKLRSYPNVSAAAVLLLLAAALIIGLVPPFLRVTRSLEISAARLLLDVDLPAAPEGTTPTLETRIRAALWFGLHLIMGGLVASGILVAVPLAAAAVVQRLDVGSFGFYHSPLPGPWQSLFGVLLLGALAVAVSAFGRLAAMMAPVLLGPSAQEQIAALQAEARRLAERNRLARDLHDSIGHTLTVTVLQAAAARELLDTDLEFARRALTAIEETSRDAVENLDHALGVLRGQPAGPTASAPTLDDVAALVSAARRAGVAIQADVPAGFAQVPDVVSQEGYRIVQEGLTNAARHAGSAPVTLTVQVSAGQLAITVLNPVPAAPPEPTDSGRGRERGRGLVGMRERVGLLDGTMTTGYAHGQWRVSVRLPIHGGAR